MKVEDVLKKARTQMGPNCKSCPICNGRACGNTMPGPGAKGTGTVAIHNYDAWQNIELNMDTLCENVEADTTFSLFGKTFQYPIFAGPVGHVELHYGDKYDDQAYNHILVRGCHQAGIAAFTGDGMNADTMKVACQSIKENEGIGIPTIKPWNEQVYLEKLEMVKEVGAFAVAMDVDAAGLPFLKGIVPPAGRKTEKELQSIIEKTPMPFIVKGIMTVKGAYKAWRAGASAIVVSNHGGRVLDGCAPTAEVLPEIVRAIDGRIPILVDGGIRTGVDVFRALALGADGVLIARPFVNMVYGAQEEGIQALVDKLGSELKDTMEMCGAKDLQSIHKDMIRLK